MTELIESARSVAAADSAHRGSKRFRLAWAFVWILGLLIAAWPLLMGIVATNDDLKFVREPLHNVPLWQGVCTAWKESPSFRPLEMIIGATTDPRTLECWWMIPVQASGLLVLSVAITGLARVALPSWPLAAPLSVLLVLLSPATTAALWQMDCASQTWSAALGAWALLLVWRVLDRASKGVISWSALVWLAIIMLLGVNIKETFYGWSAAIGSALLIYLAFLLTRRQHRGRSITGGLLLLLLVVALPVTHLVLRVVTGALGSVAVVDEGQRYQVELGVNLPLNTAMLVAGAIGTGPFHVVTDSDASPFLRGLPIVAAVVVAGLLLCALGFAVLHRSSGGWSRLAPSVLLAIIALASTSAVLTMGSVGELYCFGANIGAAVLVAAAVVLLNDPLAADERVIGRLVARVSVVLLVSIGGFGLVSRAYHFGVTWQSMRWVNDLILTHQASLPLHTDGTPSVGVVYFTAPCLLTRTYGQYVIPVMQAITPDITEPWLARLDPQRPIILSARRSPGEAEPSDLVIDCGSMPSHGHW